MSFYRNLSKLLTLAFLLVDPSAIFATGPIALKDAKVWTPPSETASMIRRSFCAEAFYTDNVKDPSIVAARQFAETDLERMMNGEQSQVTRHTTEDYFPTIHLAERFDIVRVERVYYTHYGVTTVKFAVVETIEQSEYTPVVRRSLHKTLDVAELVMEETSRGDLIWRGVQLRIPYIRPGEGNEMILHGKS